MTSQILSSELGTIISESKKKNVDLRSSAEKSLQDLKGITVTSEAQLAADLRKRPQFPNPFLNACKTNSPKLALPGVTCLQRLILSGGLSKERLQDVLSVFQECSKINLDIQLKILQSLPSFIQNYLDVLEGDLQASVLQVCITLQQVKAAAVSGTATATLQQIISSIFEKVENEDNKDKDDTNFTRLALDGRTISLHNAAHDAYRVLEDICLLTDGQRSRFISNASLTQGFGLELIESLLVEHGELFESHDELIHLLRNNVMPLVTRFLSERSSFSLTVRTTRILLIILREHIESIQTECEIPLSLLNHTLETDTVTPWKRALSMETFKFIYSTPNLSTYLYNLFDENKDKKNFIQENVAHFVRLASEKPALIGLGQQSSFPTGQALGKNSQESTIVESGSVAGIIPAEPGVNEVNVPGISTQWSGMKTACLELTDKHEPPSIPETYVYSLVLTCLNNLSEGLAKVVLPLTIQARNKTDSKARPVTDGNEDTPATDLSKEDHLEQEAIEISKSSNKRQFRRLPVNPLTLEDHPLRTVVQTIADLVDKCWPAILATSSTFLNAALDADFYRSLIRSVQKFAQVAGLLRLATPRDAFITTLAKSAIPQSVAKTDNYLSPSLPSASPRIGSGSEVFWGQGNSDTRGHAHRSSFDSTSAPLNQRNLMCLRALINLAIALGSILNQSWSIVIETLQKADNVLAQSGMTTSREYRSTNQGETRAIDSSGQTNLQSEIAAVETAVTRLFQSTSTYPDTSFIFVLRSLCNLIGESGEAKRSSGTSPRRSSIQLPRRSPSTSNMSTIHGTGSRATHFAIAKIGEIARINISRFAASVEKDIWQLLTEKLKLCTTSSMFDATARLMAADIVGSVALGVVVSAASEDPNVREEVQLRALGFLDAEVNTMYVNLKAAQEAASNTDLDVHRSALEALRAILENCGDYLISGWRSIFSIVNSTFDPLASATDEETATPILTPKTLQFTPKPISPKIARSAFACVQLIVSDFLSSIKRSRVIILIDILSQFCSQPADMNVSLTTVTLFWNVSDFLQNEMNFPTDESSALPDQKNHDFQSLQKASEQGSLSAMWMLLQNRLAILTDDDRVELRNSIVQIIFRILDSCGERLSNHLWKYSFESVILEMIRINFEALEKESSSNSEISFVSTSETIFRGLSTCFITHSDAMTRNPTFEGFWKDMLDQMQAILKLNAVEVHAFIYEAMTLMFAHLGTPDALNPAAFQGTKNKWIHNPPAIPTERISDATNVNNALVAYVKSLRQIYRLSQSKISTSEVKNITQNLTQCIEQSSAPPYTSDIDNVTALQSEVLEFFQTLDRKIKSIPTDIVKHLGDFVASPYSEHNQGPRSKGLTFVSFSKRAMDIMTQLISSENYVEELCQDGATATALSSLAQAIASKYKSKWQGKEPSMWKKGTSSSLKILNKTLSEIKRIELKGDAKDNFWSSIIQVAAKIVDADESDLPELDIMLKDETFDLESLDRLHELIGLRFDDEEDEQSPVSTALDQPKLNNRIRSDYALALVNSSFIHDHQLKPETDPLWDVYHIRPGRTYDPETKFRLRMCYATLNQLFALCAIDSSNNSTKATAPTSRNSSNPTASASPLATAAFPYLIHRCALPLKRYISDQPLRGKMPTPASQRLEILHIMKKVTELNCVVNSYSIQEYQKQTGLYEEVHVHNPRKRHLEWLVPLVLKASVYARHDREISNAFGGVLEVAFGGRMGRMEFL